MDEDNKGEPLSKCYVELDSWKKCTRDVLLTWLIDSLNSRTGEEESWSFLLGCNVDLMKSDFLSGSTLP